MMRKRNLPVVEQSSRQMVADFFGVNIAEVAVEGPADTYSLNIKENKEAQAKYKEANQFGNGSRPGSYDFNEDILVMWNGKKVQAC